MLTAVLVPIFVTCFNQQVVTLVADKLERQWLPEVCYAQFI